mmetsp:Transcript_78667/g.163584  ORF Transcript_78667/g.163584 Transcript_78667/m.163584 type:complete len:129 (-) Transcript_78667:175-561(-)
MLTTATCRALVCRTAPHLRQVVGPLCATAVKRHLPVKRALTSLCLEAPREEKQDPRAVLGVGPAASLAEVERAYNSLVLRCLPEYEFDEPEAELAEETFEKVFSAYHMLTAPSVKSVFSYSKMGVDLQ